MILASLAGLAACVLARWHPISWRLSLWQSADGLVRLAVDCPLHDRVCKLGITRYYASGSPARSTSWKHLDRVFTVEFERHQGPCYLARAGHPIEVFKGHQYWQIGIKRWALAVLLLLALSFPLASFFRLYLRRRNRRARGQCVGCGYNLKGIAEARCPECNDDGDGADHGQVTDRVKSPAAV